MGWLDSLKDIKPGETLPNEYPGRSKATGEKVVNFQTFESNVTTIEAIDADLADLERENLKFECEVDAARTKYTEAKNDLLARLHTARRNLQERIEHALPGYRITLEKIKTEPDRIETVPPARGIDKVTTEDTEHD
jgi:triphosphoribosyl-dephospho-CoA synthetase